MILLIDNYDSFTGTFTSIFVNWVQRWLSAVTTTSA